MAWALAPVDGLPDSIPRRDYGVHDTWSLSVTGSLCPFLVTWQHRDSSTFSDLIWSPRLPGSKT